jgi:hypothetical protein
VTPDEVTFDNSSLNANIRVRLKDTDTQLRPACCDVPSDASFADES